jgi:hypothetical protein
MPLQPPGGVTTTTTASPNIQGVDVAYGMSGDFGQHHQGEVVTVSSEEDFYKQFPMSATIADEEITFSKECPPLVKEVVDELCKRDAKYQRLLQLKALIQHGVSRQDIEHLARRIQDHPFTNQ